MDKLDEFKARWVQFKSMIEDLQDAIDQLTAAVTTIDKQLDEIQEEH